MSNDHIEFGPMGEDAELERMLTSLGPTVLRQEWAETQGPTPAFADSLRLRVAGKPKRVRQETRFPRWIGVLGGLAVAAIAVVLVLTLRAGSSTSTHNTAFSLPTPAPADLSKSYPLEGGRGGGGGPPKPTHSNIELAQGDVYGGRLSLAGNPVAQQPTHAAAYALEQPPKALAPYVVSLARRLGIPGKAVRAYDYLPVGIRPRLATFEYVATGTGRTAASPLRSVAVARFNGEVIIHNTTYALRGKPGQPLGRAAITSAARSWLDHLGWPGDSMPVLSIAPIGGLKGSRDASTRQIALAWPGVPNVDGPAAVLQINRLGGVNEALLRPMTAGKQSVHLRSVKGAWRLVQSGRTPVGVNIIVTKPRVPGTGTLTRTTLQYVVTTAADGRMYLIPSYRFSGLLHVKGRAGRFTWVALVPAVK